MPDQEKLSTTEAQKGPRLIPLSPAATAKGLANSLRDGERGWQIALRDLSGQVRIREALESTVRARKDIVSADEWAAVLAGANGAFYQGGAAAYYACLRVESRLANLPMPKISDADVQVWTGQGFEQPAQTSVSLQTQKANFEEFLQAHSEFDTEVSGLGWGDNEALSLKLGAADLYALIKAHYELQEQPELRPHKTSWQRD